MSGFSDPETKHWSDGALQASIWRGGYPADILDDLLATFNPNLKLGCGGRRYILILFPIVPPDFQLPHTNTHKHSTGG